jgi:hypothetical protein
MTTGIIIGETPIETLSARMEHAVLHGPEVSIPASSALDLINVVFALLEELENVLGNADYQRFLGDLPNRWESLS